MTSEENLGEVGPAPPVQGAMGRLSHAELLEAQQATLRSRHRSYGWAAKALFGLLDAVYGRPRTLSKFKVLELVARVPYQAWEQVAYVAITHTYERPYRARRIFERVSESRRQQDNEQWHLLILEELIDRYQPPEDLLRYTVIAQVLAFAYYYLS